MEGTKPRTASSLGMFDLLKGVGMLLIVFAHTSELYPVGDISTITPVTFFLFAYRESLIAATVSASGALANASASSSRPCSSLTPTPGLPLP